MAAIATQRWRPADGVPRACAGDGLTDQLQCVGLAVEDKHVARRVVVVGRQVVGIRDEGHVAPVHADRRHVAIVVGLSTVGADAHPLDRVGLAVIDEDIVVVVRIEGDEIGGRGLVHHVSSVRAKRRRGAMIVTEAVGLDPTGSDVDSLDCALACVEEKHVPPAVGIARYQRCVGGIEHDVSSIRTDV